MKKVIIIAIVGLLYTVSSCCGCGKDDNHDQHHLHENDSMITDTLHEKTHAVDTAGYVNDSLSLTTEIEKKYGVQWDFCDCIVKNDSIEKALMSTDDEAQIDLILVRMDEVDQRCKGMLAQPNTTPEQRDKHARKVKKCLKDAGVK